MMMQHSDDILLKSREAPLRNSHSGQVLGGKKASLSSNTVVPASTTAGGGEVNYDSLRDQQRDNNALKQKVEMLREQASINM